MINVYRVFTLSYADGHRSTEESAHHSGLSRGHVSRFLELDCKHYWKARIQNYEHGLRGHYDSFSITARCRRFPRVESHRTFRIVW